ncbi:MAG: AAA family ATPase [Myxococcota bacterium]
MRLHRIAVLNFRGIERAEVELQDGLNILVGPNDLGKSTLIEAIRAALMLTFSSSAGHEFVPWQKDVVPEVVLGFSVGTKKYRLTKRFGPRSAGGELEEDRGSGRFELVAKAREIEQKVRDILQWGINNPGGKSGARGMPESFVGAALLAEQTAVGEILGQSLEADANEGGRLRLTQALSALAQNPRFKALLERAQEEVDQRFTDTGRLRKNKGSELKAAADRLEELTREAESLNSILAQAEQVERRLTEAREDAHAKALALEAAKKAEADAKACAIREAELHAEEAKLEALEEERRTLEARRAALAKGTEVVRAAELALEAEKKARDAQSEAVAAAERAKKAAEESAAGQARRLRQAELERDLADKKASAERIRGEVTAGTKAAALEAEIVTASQKSKAAEDKYAARAKELSGWASKLKGAEEEVRLVEELQRFASVVRLRRELAAAEKATLDAGGARAKAEEAAQKVQGLKEALTADAIPSVEAAEKVQKLAQALSLAEARLGGGLSVRVRAAEGQAVQAEVDGGGVRTAHGAHEFEAARQLTLEVPGIVQVEILGGSPEAREQAAKAKKAWNQGGKPLLDRTKAKEAEALLVLTRKRHEALREAEEVARRLASEASALASQVLTPEALLEKRRELEAAAPAVDASRKLEVAFEKLGPEPGPKLRELIRVAQESRKAAAGKVAELQPQVAEADKLRATAQEALRSLEAQRTEVGPALVARLPELRKQLEAEEKACATVEAELGKLGAGLEASVKEATAALALAQAQAERIKAGLETAEFELSKLRSERDKLLGIVTTLEAHVKSRPYAEVRTKVETTRAQVIALRGGQGPSTPEKLEALENEASRAAAARDSAIAEVNRAEGELRRTSGPAVREQLNELEEAKRAARRTADLHELDANAWALLLKSMKESESSSTQHLGRALASRVEPRFHDLTLGNYGALDVDPNLHAKGIWAGGKTQALEALSAGTREQLATLLRISIAEALDSTIILDDQLVQSDPMRLEWFNRLLFESAARIQLIVVTCRPEDYRLAESLGGTRVAMIELEPQIKRFPRVSFTERPAGVVVPAVPVVAARPAAVVARPVAPARAPEVVPPAPVEAAVPAVVMPAKAEPATPLAELLQRAGEEAGMSKQDLAEVVGAGVRIVEQWLQGLSEPKGKFRQKLAEVLGRGAPQGSARAEAAARLGGRL